jgi:hypothetical protein
MSLDPKANSFLSQYDEQVYDNTIKLRRVLLANLPEIIEQIDLPAKMIVYCYGQKYMEMICTIIPSKKGLKLSFYKGVDLPDPDHLLEGTAKYSRYVEIRSDKQIHFTPLKRLIEKALTAYKGRISK